jgi:hypothetical protein
VVSEFTEEGSHLFPVEPHNLPGLFEVARLNFVQPVVAVPACGHRHTRFPALERSVIKEWLDGEDVIERRHSKIIAGLQKKAEVLGVSVRRGQQPENHGSPEQDFAVIDDGAAGEDPAHLSETSTTLGFVFPGRRNSQRLTEILLRKAQKAAVSGPLPVEPFNDEAPTPAESLHLTSSDRKAELAGQCETEVLVFD